MPSPAETAPVVDLPSEARFDEAFAALACVPHEPQWVALRHVVPPRFAHVGWRLGRTPEQVRALGAGLERAFPSSERTVPFLQHGNVMLRSPWGARATDVRTDAALRFAYLDWTDAARCLSAGLSVEVAAQVLTYAGQVARPGRRVEGERWVDVATCVRAGMDAVDAVTHVLADREMEPVRLVAALS